MPAPVDQFPGLDAAPVLPEWASRAVAMHDVDTLARAVVERCTEAVFHDNREDAVFISALTNSVQENTQALRDVIAGRLRLSEIPLANRLRFASLEAEMRISQAALQRSYRISFFLQWQEWCGVVTEEARRLDLGREEAVAAVTSLAALVQAYSDEVISRVALTFARSEDALNRSRAHVRQRLVQEILQGNESVLSPADLVTLDYVLGGWHLAMYLPQTHQGVATQLAVGLRRAVHPTHTLVYPARLGSSVIWLASPNAWGESRIDRVASVLDAAGVMASVSDTLAGSDGFLKSFQQVSRVEDVRAAAPELEFRSVVRYADLRLEILMMESPELARDFLRHELGPLAEDTAEAAKLRTTLEASFRLGSHVAAAEHLQLHEHTVRNRLQKAQDILGPYHERRTEIQVALRLWRLLDRT